MFYFCSRRFPDFFSLFLGVVVIFITGHTSAPSSSPSSPRRSIQIQVQVIGGCLNLFTLSTRGRQIKSAAGIRRPDLARFR
jgi:hypothetical protein